MKACVLESKNNIVCKEVANPILKDDEVLLRIKACGICSSDLDRAFNNTAYFYPLILGHEISGEIIQVANEKYSNLIGKKAVVFPLLPCKKCENCKNGFYAQCENYDYFGSRRDGGMSEFLAIPVWNLKIFDDLDFLSASLTEPAAVAINAISKLDSSNKDILIIGSGIIGILLGLFLKNKGINPVFLSSNSMKISFLENLGFKVIDHITQNTFDTTFECVGSNESIDSSLIATKARGKVILIGNPKNDLSKNIYWKILRKELNLIGVWNSIYPNDWDTALNCLKQVNIKNLITHTYKLEEVKQAFNALNDKSIFSIKGTLINE